VSVAESAVERDYALEPVPDQDRMPWSRVVVITLGIMGAMIFLQVSGEMALEFGVTNAVIALLYATLATGALAWLLAWFAARTGLNSSLITRGSGYGHAGARVTALFYAANFIVLAAVEGSIMANAIHAYVPGLPLRAWMVVLTVVNLALNWYGIHLLERFQRFSLPLYLVLLAVAIVMALRTPAVEGSSLPSGISITSILAGAGILNGIVALQALLTADYARFTRGPSLGKTLAIGLVPQVASFLVMGLIGIWFATRFRNPNPGVYLVLVMGLWGMLYTVLSQLRINVINIYSSSLSLQGFFSPFSRVLGQRAIWVTVTALAALGLMLVNVLDHIGSVLTFLGSFMFAWIGTLVADLLFARRWRGEHGTMIEYRAERLPAWGGGFVAVVVGALVGAVCALLVEQPTVNACAGFIAGAVAFLVHLALCSRKTDAAAFRAPGQPAPAAFEPEQA
jgi:purine-cytosine permease-like protein